MSLEVVLSVRLVPGGLQRADDNRGPVIRCPEATSSDSHCGTFVVAENSTREQVAGGRGDTMETSTRGPLAATWMSPANTA